MSTHKRIHLCVDHNVLKTPFLQLTPREYLETALHSVEGRGASVEAKNRVSKTLQIF